MLFWTPLGKRWTMEVRYRGSEGGLGIVSQKLNDFFAIIRLLLCLMH